MIRLYCKAKLECCTCERVEFVEIEIKSVLRVEAEMNLLDGRIPGWRVYDGSAMCDDIEACYKRAGYI